MQESHCGRRNRSLLDGRRESPCKNLHVQAGSISGVHLRIHASTAGRNRHAAIFPCQPTIGSPEVLLTPRALASGLVGVVLIGLAGCATAPASREGDPAFARQNVAYATHEPPGTIVIDPAAVRAQALGFENSKDSRAEDYPTVQKCWIRHLADAASRCRRSYHSPSRAPKRLFGKNSGGAIRMKIVVGPYECRRFYRW